MPRSIWTGVISFGLVSVPVKMYSATREHEVSFHQFQKGTSDRIRYQRINERTGKEVDYDNIVKGAEVGRDEYVMLEPGELDAVAPGRSKSLEIHRFVDLDTIDPIYFQKTYYLGPASDETAKSYALLRDAMAESNRAAIGTLVMRTKEYLATVRSNGDLLVLETMFFSDEVRDPKQTLEDMPSRGKAKPAELKMAHQLIDSMSGDWEPADFRDTYTDRVNELIKAKKSGGEVTEAEAPPAATDAKDLMDVLRRSVEAARQRTAARTSRGGTTARSTATASRGAAGGGRAATGTAKKAAAKKATVKKATAAKKTGPAKKAAPAKKTAAKKTASAKKATAAKQAKSR